MGRSRQFLSVFLVMFRYWTWIIRKIQTLKRT